MRAAERRVPWSLHVLASCLTLALVAPDLAGAQSRFSGFVVFGTSLSDPGNAFTLLGAASTPPDFSLNPLLVPSSPYAAGGHHFSNGATWIELYARSVALSQSTRPALATTSPSVTNFAIGAARSYEDGINYNLARQVQTFLDRARVSRVGRTQRRIDTGDPFTRAGGGRLLAMPAAQAFRRRCVNAQTVMRRALEARPRGPIRILGVPCGIPRDVIELACTLASEDRVLLSRIEYDGLDVDPDVLAIARRLTCDCGLGADRYHRGDALDRNDYPAGRFDLVVSTGLGEFLDDSELAAFYRIVFGTLEPGGVFYTSATAKDPKSDVLLQMIELKTHYRGVDALRSILRTCPWTRFELTEDGSRLQTFVIAVK